MELIHLLEEVTQQTRSRGDWGRVAGIALTVLFVLFSALRRGRSRTIANEAKASGKMRRAYQPIEARGFPVWIWWAFLAATAVMVALLLPQMSTLMEKATVVGVAVVALALLRVLGGRADSGWSPAADLADEGQANASMEDEETTWTHTTHGST
jgi:hypothetical protein